jgi:hypothetical protein
VKRLTALSVIILTLLSCEYEPPVYNDGPGIGALHHLELAQSQSQLIAEKGLDSALVSGATHQFNKIGRYMGLSSQFVVKFNNFTPIIGWTNVDTIEIKKAWIELYVHKVWSADNSSFMSLTAEQVATDSALTWSNYYESQKIDSLWNFLSQDGIALVQDTSVLLSDTVQIPLNLDVLDQWRNNRIINNGIRIYRSDTMNDLMAAFYAYDYAQDYSPKLKIQCAVSDTTGTLPADTLVTLYSTGDMQYSVNEFSPDTAQLLISQGAVYMSWMTLPALRTTIPEKAIINKALLTVDYDEALSFLEDASQTVQIRYLYSDNWNSYTASINNYLVNSATVFDSASSIVFDVSNILQYYIAGGAKDEDARFRFNFTNEHEGFSRIFLNPASLRFDIHYTLMTVTPGGEQ